MRFTLLRRLKILVLGTVLAGAGWTCTFDTPGARCRTPDALSHAAAPDERNGESRWRQVSQAGASGTTERGETVYQGSCAACHGAARAGVPSVFPSLIDISKRQSDAEIASQIRHGKGRMLAFPDMSDDDMKALLLFLKTPPPSDPAKPSALESAQRNAATRSQAARPVGL